MSRLKDLREARGLSQRDLAKLVDLPQSSIARYETGAYSISLAAAQRIADALECTLDQLTGRDPA